MTIVKRLVNHGRRRINIKDLFLRNYLQIMGDRLYEINIQQNECQ